VDVGRSGSLDSVDVGQSGTPDGDRLEDSESLDQVPAASSESLDSMEQTFGSSLDSVPVATSEAPDNANLVWHPTRCSQLPAPSVDLPTSSNPTRWVYVLNRTRSEIETAKDELDSATVAFGQTDYQPGVTPASRVPLGEARDAARAQYSELLCEMPVLLEAARRAGVDPGVLRPYESVTD
jgi:hypothetical protein